MEIIDDPLFKNDLKASVLIKDIIVSCLKFLVDNRQIFVYLLMFFIQLVNGYIITLIFPLLLFTYALVEYPRPRKGFWNTMIILTSCVIIIKYLFQFKFIGNELTHSFFEFMGLTRNVESTWIRIKYFIWEALLLLILLLQLQYL